MVKGKLDASKAKDFESAVKKSEVPSLTDAGNAIRFVRQHGQNIRYVSEYGVWIIWTGKRWELDKDGAIMRLAKQTAREIYAEAIDAESAQAAAAIAKHARQSESRRSLEALISLARSETGITISQDRLDADPMLLGVENGCVDLSSGELLKSTKNKYITKQAATRADSAELCPTWDKFMAEITAGDDDLVAYIQRLVGYCLSGRTGEQILAFLYGTGANGKSTFLVTLRGLLGAYARQSPAETLLARREGGINNDIARLRGARLVTCVETEDGKRLAEAMVKQLTGGDPVTARFLHQEFFEFVPEFKIFLAANHRPIIRGDDIGMWRRIHLIPFTVTIPAEKRDKALPDKLRAEWPGILAWAIRGCLAWQRDGLQPPRAVVEATQHYREEMDLIGAWISERCMLAEAAKVQASVAHRDYSKWIEDRGARAMSQMSFSRKLEERGYSRVKDGVVNFWGIGLAAQDVVACPEAST